MSLALIVCRCGSGASRALGPLGILGLILAILILAAGAGLGWWSHPVADADRPSS